jgi:hypothetical protein
MSFQNHNERREAAEAAKKAMLEKFKQKAPAEVDPKVAEELSAAALAKEEKRIEAEKRRRERVELEKLERKIAAEAAVKAERERSAREAALEAKRRKKEAEQAEIRRFEEEARRDLLGAARRRAGKK